MTEPLWQTVPTIEPPGHVVRAGVIGSPITYDWDDGDPVRLYEENHRLAEEIGSICIRGSVAVAAGCAEWIAWRLSRHCDVTMQLRYVEAVWAGIVDWRYVRDVERVPEAMAYLFGSFTPECQPAKLLLGMLDSVVRGARQHGRIGLGASSLAQLALNTMPEPKPFTTWRRTTIQRLQRLHPRDPDNPLGAPIPRRALDPELDYQPVATVELLAGLDPTTNPFLATPQEMAVAGFVGTPYRLSSA